MLKSLSRSTYIKITIIALATIVASIIIYNSIAIRFFPPRIADTSATKLEREELNDSTFVVDDSWLRKNKFGLWEMYLQGSPFDMGVKNGILTRELSVFQEEAFISQIEVMVPDERYLRFLKYFIAAFNRNIALHIPTEYQKEIYGVSLSASPKFNYISSPYHRMINYHAAHDIGHALQNLNMVMCTGLGVKNSRSEDGNIIIGRNFDLYIGDDFAKNKIATFVNPEEGHKFAFISWAGMIGVVSGMNMEGLTITYNSAKSAIPTSAKIPVSILARKILQYASTIDEAYEIAKRHETFVSGSFLVSSNIDNRIVVIEKTKTDIDIFETDDDRLVLTNHFQGEKFKNRDLNIQNINEGSSLYRWERTDELLEQKQEHNIFSFAKILRDKKGMGGQSIGLGNEKAINQLIAHHSIIFKPGELKFWISSRPYQLGQYIAYDLNKAFADTISVFDKIYNEEKNIPEDNFLFSQEYLNFEKYKQETKRLEGLLKEDNHKISETEIRNYLMLNPDYYYPKVIAGRYYLSIGDYKMAEMYFRDALSRKIPWESERQRTEKYLESIKIKSKK